MSESNRPASENANIDFSKGTSNKDWWPDSLDLGVLHQNSDLSNPMGSGFRYID